VDVGAVVRDVLWALGPQVRARAADVEVGELPTVMAEKSMLRQIFQNLVSNAIKFGDPGRPWVRIRAVREPGAWRFEVEDNGAGIEPRHAERVFEMFQRLHGRDVPGSGMGLAIVKRLTERLGGRVGVQPAQPKGSIFTVTIPDRPRPL
jgi:signal transduction histidine kinase